MLPKTWRVYLVMINLLRLGDLDRDLDLDPDFDLDFDFDNDRDLHNIQDKTGANRIKQVLSNVCSHCKTHLYIFNFIWTCYRMQECTNGEKYLLRRGDRLRDLDFVLDLKISIYTEVRSITFKSRISTISSIITPNISSEGLTQKVRWMSTPKGSVKVHPKRFSEGPPRKVQRRSIPKGSVKVHPKRFREGPSQTNSKHFLLWKSYCCLDHWCCGKG